MSSRSASAGHASLVVAELGPTNTGKTHRAIERMLEHESGMIGLPLRLLAREVYDRMTARVGEGQVALVTGEEKRLPRHPRYWVCTVESMPTERAVDFLAVDEIQLAAHRERGHVFTERLLHARGRKETWFLGADTMRPMLQRLVPEANFHRSGRLSQLRHFGRRSLKGLPPRTAVVAFSVDRVYELAESIRSLRGGVAVVLGALSPRTRNAQVAMYQAGEVQYLVATDAIGMGLNLELDHVVFAALSKFDGAEQRELMPDELAQIAGRAGRHWNDGAFGTLKPLPELAPPVVHAIENHRFAPVRTLVWRNERLDFSDPDALLDSLVEAPRHAGFVRVERADDFDALKALARMPEIRERTPGRADVQRLWQVCQIPDFRKGLFGHHVGLLRETFLRLCAGDGELDEAWLREKVAPLDNVTGDLHVLMDRLAAIRIWTYISQRPGWIRNAEEWQERTRRVEDALGDALHERLVERFVARAARRARRRFVRGASEGAAAVPNNPFAQLWRADGEGAEPSEEQYVQRLVDAPHEAFEVDGWGRVAFEGEPLARLVRGRDARTPQVALVEPEIFTSGARRQVERRLLAWARDLVTLAMGGFPAEPLTANGVTAPTRGLAYRLAEGFGVVPRDEADESWRLLVEEERKRFEGAGCRRGTRYLYVEGAFAPGAFAARAALVTVFDGGAPVAGHGAAVLALSSLGERDAFALGYERVAGVALRLDVAERVAAAGEPAGGTSSAALLTQVEAMCRESGVDPALAKGILRALGAVPEPETARPQAAASRKRRRRRRTREDTERPLPSTRHEEWEEDGDESALRKRLM